MSKRRMTAKEIQSFSPYFLCVEPSLGLIDRQSCQYFLSRSYFYVHRTRYNVLTSICIYSLQVTVAFQALLSFVIFLFYVFQFLNGLFFFFCCFLPQDPNWYRARNIVGREGTIPANYVQKREGVKSGGKLSLMP